MVSSKFWKVAVNAPGTDKFRRTFVPFRRLKVGPPFQDWPLLRVTGTRAAVMAACMHLGYRPVGAEIDGGEPSSDGAVGLRRGVVGRERCSDRCVPLDDGHVGHQRIGDGLVHCSGVAVVGQLRIRVIFGLGHGSHEVEGDLCLREVIAQGRRNGIVGLQDRVVPAERGEHPGLAGLRGRASASALL